MLEVTFEFEILGNARHAFDNCQLAWIENCANGKQKKHLWHVLHLISVRPVIYEYENTLIFPLLTSMQFGKRGPLLGIFWHGIGSEKMLHITLATPSVKICFLVEVSIFLTLLSLSNHKSFHYNGH